MLFIWGGYLFGNIPLVKHNFGLVTILIILVSLLPIGGDVLPLPDERRLLATPATSEVRTAARIGAENRARAMRIDDRQRRQSVAQLARLGIFDITRK